MEIFLESCVEEHAHTEVAKHHHIGDWLHYVPTVVDEGSAHDEPKLGEKDRGGKSEEGSRAEIGFFVELKLLLIQSDELLLSFLYKLFYI